MTTRAPADRKSESNAGIKQEAERERDQRRKDQYDRHTREVLLVELAGDSSNHYLKQPKPDGGI